MQMIKLFFVNNLVYSLHYLLHYLALYGASFRSMGLFVICYSELFIYA